MPIKHWHHWVHTVEIPCLYGMVTVLSDLGVDFVTWRGHLTKLLTTPYETREGWMLAVTQLRGTLYMSEVETEAARRDREARSERHQQMMYWGYKFEQYTCAGRAVCLCLAYLQRHRPAMNMVVGKAAFSGFTGAGGLLPCLAGQLV